MLSRREMKQAVGKKHLAELFALRDRQAQSRKHAQVGVTVLLAILTLFLCGAFMSIMDWERVGQSVMAFGLVVVLFAAIAALLWVVLAIIWSSGDFVGFD